MQREKLGEVTCPSGILVVVDFGLLGMWSHDAAPVLPDWIAGPEIAAKANGARDFRVEGPDAAGATQIFGQTPGWLYDRSAGFEAAFAEAIEEEGFEASLRALPERVPHRSRIDNALANGCQFGAASFHGPWASVVAVMPAAEAFSVYATRLTDGEYAGRWKCIELAVGRGDVASTEAIGDVPVDWARLAFADADALGAWKHDESFDGKADFVFWGRDAQAIAVETEAPKLDDGTYGWVDLDLDEAIARGTHVERMSESGDRKFATDFRPHSHHYQIMKQVRAADTESGTIDVGDALMCGFMTSWGDGVFPIERDLDADGRLLSLRIQLEETGRDNMDAMENPPA